MARDDSGADGLEVTVGRPAKAGIPLISCGAPDGYACGVGAIRRNVPDRAEEVFGVCARMMEYPAGALVAVVSPPFSARPLVLVQDSRGRYYTRHDSGHAGWQDFYYATAWAAFKEIDCRWGATQVELDHPSHGPWPANVLPAVLAALCDLLDEGALSLRHLHVYPCSGRVDQAAVDASRRALSTRPLSRRPVVIEPFPLERIGLAPIPGIDLRQVHLPPVHPDGRPVQAGRPPERIPVVLKRLGEAWSRHPDMRLGQLLLNLTNTGPSPLFDMEDTALAARIEDFLETGRWGHETGLREDPAHRGDPQRPTGDRQIHPRRPGGRRPGRPPASSGS